MRWLLLLLLLAACRAQGLPEPYATLERGGKEALRQVALEAQGYAGLLAGWLLVGEEDLPLAERAEYAWRYALFLEEVRAFEPGWEAEAAWRVAAAVAPTGSGTTRSSATFFAISVRIRLISFSTTPARPAPKLSQRRSLTCAILIVRISRILAT